MTASDLIASLPLLILAATAFVIMVGTSIRRSHRMSVLTSFVGFALAFASLWPASAEIPVHMTSLLVIDRYALLYMGLILAASMAVVLLAYPYLEARSEHKDEFYVLAVLATLGSMILAATTHAATLFLGLELLSVSLYALISYLRTETLPLEAGIKYLVLAASSSAFLLFGLALIYVVSGNLQFSRISDNLPYLSGNFTYLMGLVLVITGIGFKLAIVPFHLWTPDVYEGAPAPVTAFVATVSKGGVFAFLLRWVRVGGASNGPLLLILAVIAIASMIAGNLLALRQTNVKRLLAYSSIAHMGYFLVALVCGGTFGSAAATYYLAAYLLTILGAFGSLVALSDASREAETFDDVRGLFWRRPLLACVFTAMLLSLAGIPLTAGFLGKFYVLAAGASTAAWVLVLVLIGASTIGLVYYLRVIVAMFTSVEVMPGHEVAVPFAVLTRVTLAILTGGLFVLGVYPGPLWRAITSAAANLG